MTLQEAKKILGKEAEGMTDSEIEIHINSANLLKEIFFDMYLNGIKSSKKIDSKIPFINAVE